MKETIVQGFFIAFQLVIIKSLNLGVDEVT